jgi:hypothetical protein
MAIAIYERATRGYFSSFGVPEELLRPGLWVEEAAADAERGVPNPTFEARLRCDEADAERKRAGRAPDQTREDRAMGLACAWIDRLHAAGESQARAAEIVAGKLRKGGFKMPSGKRGDYYDREVEGPRLLSMFWKVRNAAARKGPKGSAQHADVRRLRYFRIALKATERMPASEGAKAIETGLLAAGS